MQDFKKPKQFNPWMGNLVMAFYGLVSLAMAWRFLFKPERFQFFLAAVAICGGFTVYHWSQFMRRTWGKRVEAKSCAELAKLVSRLEKASVLHSVPLPYGGDADVVLVLSGVRYVLEIKSIESAGKVTDAHAAQAAKAGNALFGVPVVWLPRSKSNEAREKNGVIVFGGPSKALIKYLGALK